MRHEDVPPNIARGLKELRGRIDRSAIPSSKLDEAINIASWNIREFGRKRNGKFRTQAAIHYIAEIIGQFDLVSIVELRDKLTDLRRVMKLLGPSWKVIFSDFNPDRQGNRERIAFLYDERAVVPTGLAAEADPPRQFDAGTGEYRPLVTWWRSPYMASFRAGAFGISILSVHVRWGDSEATRLRELTLLADWIDQRQRDSGHDDQDMIVCGDFNIPDFEGPLFHAITSKGLEAPEGLRKLAVGTNLAKDKRYDQFLHSRRFRENYKATGGVLDFYADDWRALFPADEYPDMTQQEFTYQMSDHLPLWIQIDIDNEEEVLDNIIKGQEAITPQAVLAEAKKPSPRPKPEPAPTTR